MVCEPEFKLVCFKDTGCTEMDHLGFGVVLDAGDSYRQTVLTGLESALSRYV